MLTCTVTPDHRKVIDRLNARTDACQQTGGACWCLCEQNSIACPMFPNFLLQCLGKALDEFALHILFAIKPGKWSLFYRIISRGIIGRIANRAIDALNNRE